jgi:hypothetical protein
MFVQLSVSQAISQQPNDIPDFTPQLTDYVLNPESKIADVGAEAIWSHELLPTINQMVEEHEGKAPQSELDRQRVFLVSKLLNRHVESKLLYIDFLRSLPAGKEEEILEGIYKQVQEEFYSSQVPRLMEQMKVESLTALDNKLRKYGSSISQQLSQFREQAIAQSMIGKTIVRKPLITHKELLDYYYEHAKDYEFPAKVRYEKLTANFEKMPNRVEADWHIVEMGNQVLRGAKFANVAKRFSHGVNRNEGGYHDWTSKGSLVSDVLDKAIFSLPVGKMSPIFRDQTGFHIVRVLERKDAGRTSFAQAQKEIREELQAQKRTEQIREYVAELKRKTRVITIFEPQQEGVADLANN